MTPISKKGVLGHFCEPADALAAAAKVRDAGWKHFDFLTPFPIHGMEEAMGQKRSWIPYVTAVLAVCGILFAQGLQNYVMVWDWPMNFGGKPHAAWPAFIPITFEAMCEWAERAERLGFDSIWVSDHFFYSFDRYGVDPTPIAAIRRPPVRSRRAPDRW